MRHYAILALVGASFGLAACGDSGAQRIATGAAGGAVAGQLIDERPVEGAVIGGTIGALR